MFAKRLLQKATHHHHDHDHDHQQDAEHGTLKPTDLDPQIQVHIGIPLTASVLAVDPVQRLLAIGTLDGRIKVVGGDNIEALFISSKQSSYKNLEFLQNQGYLVGILIDNDIQVCNLVSRCITCNLQWESNITAFSTIHGSPFMLVGDEYGIVSVLKFAAKDGKLVDMRYQISPDYIVEKTGISFPSDQHIVGVLPQPCSSGNRLLIAYQYGLIILWDVLEAKVVVSKGDNDLHVKGHLSKSPREVDIDPINNPLEQMNEKEISAICWASSSGSMLAVGYIDGDILLWNMPTGVFPQHKTTSTSCNDVVKLQLSSAKKRLPVIVLRWGVSSTSQNSCDGQLFVYGGSEVGSEEVITVVTLQWFDDMERLKSVRRVDLALIGSFADIVLLSSLGIAAKSHSDGLFLLTSPGKLQFYDVGTLSTLAPQQGRTSSVSGIEFPMVAPSCNPQMTAAKLTLQPCDGKLSMWLSEVASVGSTVGPADGRTWPLTGGVRSEIPSAEEKYQTRIYTVGYQDGSVRIWDATNPILSLVLVLEGQVHGIENADSNVSVTKLDLCASMMTLAVGTECGLVRFYNLSNDTEVIKLHFVKHSGHEVFDVPPRKGPQCKAVFSLVNSPVRSLQFSLSGAKLAVGFESSHVAVLDINSLSVLFLTDSIISSKYPVISVMFKTFSDAHGLRKGPKHYGPKNPEQPSEELMFTLTHDAKFNIVDSKTGTPISSRPLHLKKEHTAISMYVLEASNFTSASSLEQREQSNKETEAPSESKADGSGNVGDLRGTELSMDGERLLDSQVLLCCEKVLRLYNMKSVIQGEDKPIHKVKLATTCCWTSIFKKDDKVCGLILCYQTGVLEVRSFPDLEMVMESSLMSVLRWNFRPNMEKMTTSSDNGQICLANGSELAFISVSSDINETRFLEPLPLLHDKVVAAAADAAIWSSGTQKKQAAGAGILGGIVKGLRKEKPNNAKDTPSGCHFAQLEEIFSRSIGPDSSPTSVERNKEEELDIDDIEIDELFPISSTSSHPVKGKTTQTDRDRLFEGTTADTKPRTRTPEEIMAAYRGAEYASSAAERARNKLLERQEKLEKISQRTEELRSGAEDFASLANELAKTMEGRKWWKI